MKEYQELLYRARLTTIILVAVISSIGCGAQPYQKIKVPEVPPPVSQKQQPINVALVLSSGGFRGSAHIGVIEVLEENGIHPDLIVGTSAGSFVGAFYADEPNAEALKAKLLNTKYDQLVDTSWIKALQAPFCPTGPVRGRALQQFMLQNMQSRDFADLKIPLIVVTTSLMNNQVETIQTGPIIPAVHASSALPPYFAPVRIYENMYIDGAAIAPVPVAVAREYNPKMIIAVDICKKPSMSELKNAFQITGRAMDISFHELAKRQASGADFVIRPDIIGYGPFEDEYNNEFYLAGRKAALEQVAAIKNAFLKINHEAP